MTDGQVVDVKKENEVATLVAMLVECVTCPTLEAHFANNATRPAGEVMSEYTTMSERAKENRAELAKHFPALAQLANVPAPANASASVSPAKVQAPTPAPKLPEPETRKRVLVNGVVTKGNKLFATYTHVRDCVGDTLPTVVPGTRTLVDAFEMWCANHPKEAAHFKIEVRDELVIK